MNEMSHNPLSPRMLANCSRRQSPESARRALGQNSGGPWLIVAVAVALVAFASSDRLLAMFLPRSDIVLALLLLCLLPGRKFQLSAAGIGLICAIVYGSVLGGETEWGIGRAAKLCLVFLLVARIGGNASVSKWMLHASIAIVVVNALLVVLIACGVGWACGEVSAGGRMSTALTYPGGLARVAIVPLFYFSYFLLHGKRVTSSVLGLGCCLLVAWRDGSRTFVLLALICWALLLLIAILEGRATGLIAMIVVAATCALGMQSIAVDSFDSENPVSRWVKAVDSFSYSGLGALDSIRHELNQKALTMIFEAPIEGHGIGTARLRSNVHNSGFEVVHNAYLQIWAECGLLGVVSLAGVLMGWMPSALRRLDSIRRIADIEHRCMIYNAMACLVLFAFMKLTHPLGSELNDWMLFVVSTAIIRAHREFGRGTAPRRQPVKGVCAFRLPEGRFAA